MCVRRRYVCRSLQNILWTVQKKNLSKNSKNVNEFTKEKDFPRHGGQPPISSSREDAVEEEETEVEEEGDIQDDKEVEIEYKEEILYDLSGSNFKELELKIKNILIQILLLVNRACAIKKIKKHSLKL